MKSAFGPREAALLGLLALFWGHSFLFIKIAVAELAPVWIVSARMTIGGLLLCAVTLAARVPVPRDGRTLRILAVIGIFGSALPWACQAWSQHFLDSGLVAVLNAFTPLATLALAVVTGQERLERSRLVGIALAIAGTLIVVGGEVHAGRSPLALGAAVLATFGYAYAAVYTRAHVSGKIGSLPAAALQLVFGALVLWPVAALSIGAPPTLSSSALLALGGLGVLGTGLAFAIYFTLIERVGATNTSMVTYLTPMVAMGAGAFYRGERFGPNVYVGSAALITGVWLAQRVRP